MFFAPRQLKNAREALSAFMVIWLSGLVLLLACNVKMTGSAEMEFCPLTKLGAHCDKADKNKDSQVLTTRNDEQRMDCCAFIAAFFDKTRTFDTKPQLAPVATVATVETPRSVSLRTNSPSAISYHSIALLKNDTFLKNRTFRI